MTYWEQLQSLQGEDQAKIGELLGKYALELEVQSHLAAWLENQLWYVYCLQLLYFYNSLGVQHVAINDIFDNNLKLERFYWTIGNMIDYIKVYVKVYKLVESSYTIYRHRASTSFDCLVWFGWIIVQSSTVCRHDLRYLLYGIVFVVKTLNCKSHFV